MRLQLDDPSRRDQLCDYFLRLGAQTSANADGTIQVDFADHDDADVEGYLANWAETNRVEAAVISDTAPIADKRGPFEILPRAASDWRPPMRLGDLLVSKGFISADQLAQALVESREQGELLGLVLMRHRWVFEDELARTLAEQWNLPYVHLRAVGVDRLAMQLLPSEIGLRFAAVPVRFMDRSIQVAFADPSGPGALEAVREFLPSITLAIAEFSDIRMLWQSAA